MPIQCFQLIRESVFWFAYLDIDLLSSEHSGSINLNRLRSEDTNFTRLVMLQKLVLEVRRCSRSPVLPEC